MKTIISGLLISLTLLQSGCGLLFGGRINECQSTKPPTGQPKRAIRPAAFIFDLFWVYGAPVALGIDFITGAIYKPCEYITTNTAPKTPVNTQIPVASNTITPTNNSNSEVIGQQQTVQMVDSKPKGTTSYLDYKYGFRDAKFEMAVEQFTDMTPDLDSSNSTNKREQFYHRPSDVMTIGEYHLSDILYIFYHGRLMNIMIETKGLTNSRGMLAMLQDLFGNGFKDNEYIEEYYWKGGKTTLLYDENSITHDARIWFDCTKLENQNRDEEKQNQKQAEKGF